jgi:ribosome-associated protein
MTSSTPGGPQKDADLVAPISDKKFLAVTRDIRVPLAEFSFTFSRSGGPGGQNVNKVSSKAQLRWPVAESTSLPPDVHERFIAKNRHRLTSDGDFMIQSQKYRDQPRNIADCLEKLKSLLMAAVVKPVKRKKTKPTGGSRRRRLANKRRHAETKKLRQRPGGHE